MALRSHLSLVFYSLVNPIVQKNYEDLVQNLKFTTVSPGGFGELTAELLFIEPTVLRSELQLFSRVAVMAGLDCLFLGEVTEAHIVINQTTSMVRVTALGLGASLRDDPQNAAYTNQTGLQILTNQLSLGTPSRSNYLIIDSDTSAILANNPGATFSPSYASRTMEEVIADVAMLVGDYEWGVWSHATHKDALGFPTGQLVVKVRDTTTTHWRAGFSTDELYEADITYNTDRAYNVIEIKYYDPTNTAWNGVPVSTATYTDSRLSGTGAQGSAPFRRRKYTQDFSSTSTVTATQAQNIANTYGAQFQNELNKNVLKLRSIRDGYGGPSELYRVRAGQNIFCNEVQERGIPLPLGLNAVNQFYIVQSSYTETPTDAILELQCDNYDDQAAIMVARLQLANDLITRSTQTTSQIQATGAPSKGWCGGAVPGSVNAQVCQFATSYDAVMTAIPTSLSLSTVSSNAMGSLTYNSLSVYGFNLQYTASGANSSWFGTYVTVGNCLLSVNEDTQIIGHHCDHCDSTRNDIPFSALMVHDMFGTEPGQYTITVECPCGTTEVFNTALTEEDESLHDARRQDQVILIRRLQKAMGLRYA